jgi:hypothetical protein
MMVFRETANRANHDLEPVADQSRPRQTPIVD